MKIKRKNGFLRVFFAEGKSSRDWWKARGGKAADL
jgi:hypothetical protein